MTTTSVSLLRSVAAGTKGIDTIVEPPLYLLVVKRFVNVLSMVR